MPRRIFSPEEVTRKVTTFRQNRAKPDNASQFVSVLISTDFSSRNRFSEGENPRSSEIRKTGICFSKPSVSAAHPPLQKLGNCLEHRIFFSARRQSLRIPRRANGSVNRRFSPFDGEYYEERSPRPQQLTNRHRRKVTTFVTSLGTGGG